MHSKRTRHNRRSTMPICHTISWNIFNHFVPCSQARKNMILILANLNIRSVICLEMKHWYRTQKSRAHCDAHHTVHCSVMSECVWILPVVRPQGGWMAASLRIGPSPMNANSSLSRTSWIPAGVSWIMVFSSDILFHIFLCGSYWLVLNVSYVFDESTTVTW